MTNEETAPAGWYDDGTGRQRWFDGNEWKQYADEAEPALATPVPVTEGEPLVVRRTRRAPFKPPAPETDADSGGATVSRSWALGLRSANAKKDSGLTRNRRIAGELPEWSPLPPGELGVDRMGGRQG